MLYIKISMHGAKKRGDSTVLHFAYFYNFRRDHTDTVLDARHAFVLSPSPRFHPLVFTKQQR
jgi:hypothetical protein